MPTCRQRCVSKCLQYCSSVLWSMLWGSVLQAINGSHLVHLFLRLVLQTPFPFKTGGVAVRWSRPTPARGNPSTSIVPALP